MIKKFFQNIKKWIKSMIAEIKSIHWPERQIIIKDTLIVGGVTAIISLLIALYDMGVQDLIYLIIK